jgi:hypothetical protein
VPNCVRQNEDSKNVTPIPASDWGRVRGRERAVDPCGPRALLPELL